MYVFKSKLALSTQSDLIVAIATIHRSLFAKLEGEFVLYATLRLNRRFNAVTYSCCSHHFRTKYSPPGTGTVAVTVRTPCFVSSAACGATFRLIGKAFSLVELLFSSSKGKRLPTIGALK